MKNKITVLFLVLCLIQSGCERDDICAESTPTTPLLIIDFFDANNPAEVKIPIDLGIIEDGETDPTNGRIYNTATIAIPLRTDDNQTVYKFILNANANEDSEEEINTDLLTFTYGRSEEFVSKACGFRVTYTDLDAQSQGGVDNDWIQTIETINPLVVNDTITHIRILH